MKNFFNRENLPYMNNGRWYKFFIESDGSTYTLTTSEIEGAEIVNSQLKLPAGYHIIDNKEDVHSTGAETYFPYVDFDANDTQAFTIPMASSFDYMTLYLFCHK